MPPLKNVSIPNISGSGGGSNISLSSGAGASMGGIDIKKMLLQGLGSPLGMSTLLGLGGGIISSISNRGRRKKAEANVETAIGSMEGDLGQDIFDPLSASSFAKRGIYDEAKSMGNIIDQSLGLDSGQGQGALFGATLGKRLGSLGSNYVTNKQGVANRDLSIKSNILNVRQNQLANI